MTGVEGEDVISAQVATVTQSGLGQQVALISQDGTQHVSNHSVRAEVSVPRIEASACRCSKCFLNSVRILDKYKSLFLKKLLWSWVRIHLGLGFLWNP